MIKEILSVLRRPNFILYVIALIVWGLACGGLPISDATSYILAPAGGVAIFLFFRRFL